MIPSTLHLNVRRLHLLAKRAVEDWLGGAYHSVFKGVGVSFEEVREYQPGDDVRALDWNVTARTGAPFVKRFVEERELTVMVAVDVGPSMGFGSGARNKRQIAAETAALVAMAALRNNDRVGMLLFGDGAQKLVPPRKGTRHAMRLLRDLLVAAEDDDAPAPIAQRRHLLAADRSLPRSPNEDLVAALQTMNRVLRRRSLVFLASDFLCPGYVDTFRMAAARHDLIAIFLQDAWERDLPDVGVLSLRNPETGDLLLLDTAQANLREVYRVRMTGRVDELRQTARRAGADLIDLTTAGDHLDSLRRFFQMRQHRLRR